MPAALVTPSALLLPTGMQRGADQDVPGEDAGRRAAPAVGREFSCCCCCCCSDLQLAWSAALLLLLPPLLRTAGRLEHCWHGMCIKVRASACCRRSQPGATHTPAPMPQVPNGWYSYVAELFSWALGRPVDEESCKKCAKREPGRR